MKWSRSQLLRSRTGLAKFYDLNHYVNIPCGRKPEYPEKNDVQYIYHNAMRAFVTSGLVDYLNK